jgi:hypothetical protein
VKRHGRTGVALAAVTTCLAGTVVGLPLLAAAGGDFDADGFCTPGQLGTLTDGSPTIIGAATLTYAELLTWWESTDRAHPPRLGISIDDVFSLYLAEGDAEGVRGDLALAQAIHETGWFTSSDTAINNFAGIAHPTGAGSGQGFPEALTGIRAHIQLLKKYAEGNDVDLVHPDVAPDAGAQADTWEQLAGSWAADEGYWTALSDLYTTMLDQAGRPLQNTPPPAEPDTCAQPVDAPGDGSLANGALVSVRGITVAASIAPLLDDMLAAAEADGHTLTGSGYRSTARQIELRRAHCGTDPYAIYEMPARDCSPPTAPPGSSLHEQGLAIDFDNCNSRSTRCYQWLAANAARFGLFNLPSEPWHWSTTGD